MAYKSRAVNRMRLIELSTKNTLAEKLANKENLLIPEQDNVILDRESIPGKTLIKVTVSPDDIVLLPETSVIVDHVTMALSSYIENTSISKVVIRDLLPEETQAEAVASELNRLRNEETSEAERKAPILIQRKQGETGESYELYDIYILIRPSDITTTWRLKRIGGDTVEHPVFVDGATAGTTEHEANFKSYVKPIDSDENVLVGTVRNIDILVDPEAGKCASDYNEKDCISVTRVNQLADILFIKNETETTL